MSPRSFNAPHAHQRLPVPWLCFLLCYLGYASIYISRMNLSIASPELIARWNFTATQLGVLGSVFFCVYALGRLFNGNVSDRIAPYIMLFGGLVLTGVANLFAGVFLSFIPMILLWGLNAYGQSVLWGSILRTVAAVYSDQKRIRMTSLIATTVASGNVAGVLLNIWVIDAFGIRYAFLIPGMLNVLIALLIFHFTRPVPFQASAVVQKNILREILSLIRNPRIVPMLFPAVSMGMMKDSITFWLAVYFTFSYSIDLKGSMILLLSVPFVGLVGRLLYQPIYRVCQEDEHRVSRISFLVCLAFSALLMFPFLSLPLSAVAFSMIYFAVSVMNTSFLSIYPLRFLTNGNCASVSGVMDFMNYMGAGIASLVYGFLIDRFGFLAMFCSWCFISFISFLILRKFAEKAK